MKLGKMEGQGWFFIYHAEKTMQRLQIHGNSLIGSSCPTITFGSNLFRYSIAHISQTMEQPNQQTDTGVHMTLAEVKSYKMQ